MKILYIEDELSDQLALERLIKHQQLPYQLVTVRSAPQARTLLMQQPFDVILSDYCLGGETAFDILPTAGAIPLVIITGNGNEELAVRAMKAGAYDYVVKDMQQDYLKILPIVLENTVKRKTAEIQAYEAQKEIMRRDVLHQFVQDAAHDLRTLLATLNTSLYACNRYLGNLSELLRDAPPDIQALIEKFQARVSLTQQHERHLEKLLLDMLEIVRLDTTDTLDLIRCDLTQLTAESVRTHAEQAAQASLTLVFEPAAERAWCLANPSELYHALHELLQNALRFTPAPGTISVRTVIEAAQVTVEIADTGIGIDAADLDHIFQRFYRINKARTMNHGSSGLGLALVKRIVELHDGVVTVESLVNVGTCLRVSIPKID